MLSVCFNAWGDHCVNEQVKRIAKHELNQKIKKANRYMLKKSFNAWKRNSSQDQGNVDNDESRSNSPISLQSMNYEKWIQESIKVCKCNKKLCDDCLYGMIKETTQFVCTICQCYDEAFTNYANDTRANYNKHKKRWCN